MNFIFWLIDVKHLCAGSWQPENKPGRLIHAPARYAQCSELELELTTAQGSSHNLGMTTSIKSSGIKSKSKAKQSLAVEAISRRPQQGRSKASLERMLAAAETLMVERGNEDFTLQDVSRTGEVSIGSIYLRFESKENLVRAVIANHLERIADDESAMIGKVSSQSRELADFVRNFVDAYAEFLREHAPMLRLAMDRARHDPLVSGPGKETATRAARVSAQAMLAFADEIGGEDRELKAYSAFNVIFSTLARQLSLGSSAETAQDLDWMVLKLELARMCLAYLKHQD